MSTSIVQFKNYLEKHAEKMLQEIEAPKSAIKYLSASLGRLKLDGDFISGDSLPVIILGVINENTLYESPYNPNHPTLPSCAAIGAEKNNLKPLKPLIEAGIAKSEACSSCEMNKFGSKGAGKACKNSKKLVVLPVGHFNEMGNPSIHKEVDAFISSPLAVMKLPVTSVKDFEAYVLSNLVRNKLPPMGYISRLKVVPHVKYLYQVVFDYVSDVPDSILGAVLSRQLEAEAILTTPPSTEYSDKLKKEADGELSPEAPIKTKF